MPDRTESRTSAVGAGVSDWREYLRVRSSASGWQMRELLSVKLRWDHLIELGAIILWAVWFGRDYLDLDPTVWPFGREFASAIQTHFVWDLLSECGGCIFWNGFVRGGAPAFAEIHGSLLHPLVIITTLFAGVINGAKIALVASFAMAGFAQWWLARVMGLGVIARLWSAGLAVAGGHLAARMELGAFGVVLSAAGCSLILAPGLKLALTGERRAAILLGITLALALVAGQGYMQVGMLMGLLPAFGVFLVDQKLQLRPIWREFALAGVLAVLLAGILWSPLLHFWPNVYKDIDPNFGSAQPLVHVPLNLVIGDVSFYSNGALSKLPYPHLYANYIGWVPVLFALLALRLVPRAKSRELIFFIIAIVLVFLAGSAYTLRLIGRILPNLAAGVRHPAQISALAVPPLLALAAWGLDRFMKLDWPRLALTTSDQPEPPPSVSLGWVIVILPLIWSIRSAYQFGQTWVTNTSVDDGIYEVIGAIEPETAQWVKTPLGEHFWVSPALDAGLKLSPAIRTWDWKERDAPPAYIEGTREPVDTLSPNYVETVDGINIIKHPANQYAFIDTGTRQIPCAATAYGGNIDVDCNAETAGTLVIRENRWTGWNVTRDGEAAKLGSGQWLSVAAPAGEHHYEFRYRPWDVVVGLLLTLIGICATVWLWFRAPAPAASEQTTIPQSESSGASSSGW